MGDEDAYNRVFDSEHRDIVKEAFNAMIHGINKSEPEAKEIGFE